MVVATLTINGYSGTLNTQGYSLTVSSALIQTSGTISLGTSTVAMGGDFLRSGGTFNAGTSTVTLSGSTIQTLTGSTTFYGLRALTSGATLQFTAGTTQYVTNMVEFRNVSLKSTTDNATWYFSYAGSSQTLVGLRVKDSNAASGSVMNAQRRNKHRSW